MAAPKRRAPAKTETTPDSASVETPDAVEQATEPEAAAEQTPEAEPETTTDYTRRAGGYVLTDRGWVIPPAEGVDQG
jgi:hypothetical protein